MSGSAEPVPPARPVTLARVVVAEWRKLRTLRSTVALVVIAIGGMVFFGGVIAYHTRDPADAEVTDLVASGPLQGYYLGQLLLGALGVLVVSTEFGTGLARATFAAVPRRWPVLVAKVLVVTAVVLPLMVLASAAAYEVARAVLDGYRTTIPLTEPSTLRVVIGTGVYLTLIALLGSGIAWVVRSTPGSLVATFGLLLVLPVVCELLLGDVGKRIAVFLPTVAGASFSTTLGRIVPHSLSPVPGLLVMIAWVIAGLVAAWVTLRLRDV